MNYPSYNIFGMIKAILIALSFTLAMSSSLPANSWDSHIHVIDPARFPLDPGRDYTPKPATRLNVSGFQAPRGIAHSIVVQPSVYGYDNAALLDALAYFNGSARGVAVVNPDNVTEAILKEYHAAGVRGLRVNFGNDGTDEEIVESVQKNAIICRKHDWTLQIWVPLRSFQSLHKVIPGLGVRVVTDHFGHAEVGSKTGNVTDTLDPYSKAGFEELIDLVKNKYLYVKLSAPYQSSKAAPLYADLALVARELFDYGPDMVVYGSDWPHTSSKEGNAAAGGRLVPQNYRKIDDAAIVEEYKVWSRTPEQLHKLFVDNPRQLWTSSDHTC